MPETLIEMAKALVLAQIEARHVTPDNIQTVLRTTYDALHQLQVLEADDSITRAGGQTEANPAPSNWQASITRHAVTCLECGDSFKQLSRRHLQRHGLDSRTYRHKYGIPSAQPLSSRAATARRRQLAKSIRPWEKAHAARSTTKRSSGAARAQGKSAPS